MVPDKSRQASDKIDKRGDLSHRVTFKLAFFPAKGFNMWVGGKLCLGRRSAEVDQTIARGSACEAGGGVWTDPLLLNTGGVEEGGACL